MDRNFESEMSAELELEAESEFEHELEAELEHESEFESELESEAELEAGDGELEAEFELEGGAAGELEMEGELENELELEQGEQFFGALKAIGRGVGTVLRNPAVRNSLKRLARTAVPVIAKTVGGAIGGPWGDFAHKTIGNLSGLLREQELEANEFEMGEQELSYELGEQEMMAESLAHFAAQAQQELEAEAMIGAATLGALSAADRRALRHVLRHLVRGAAALTRVLRKDRYGRTFVRAVPAIVSRTARSLRDGRPVTRKRAALAMARQTHRALSNPRFCAAALRRNLRATRVVAQPYNRRRRA